MQDLIDSFVGALEELWARIVDYAPTFFGALVVLIIGIIISILLGKLARKLVVLSRIDRFYKRIDAKSELWGLDINFASLAEWFVKWFFYIVTLVTVVDILNIPQLNVFLERLVLYLPNVLIAIIIIVLGFIAGKLVRNIVEGSLRGFRVREDFALFLGRLSKWSILLFALMAALVQLGIAANLVQILFTGLVFMVAIAGGLAFGLGGRDHASRALDSLEDSMGRKKTPRP
jgi:hypothetical protein